MLTSDARPILARAKTRRKMEHGGEDATDKVEDRDRVKRT
jgi:hypothetical protein